MVSALSRHFSLDKNHFPFSMVLSPLLDNGLVRRVRFQAPPCLSSTGPSTTAVCGKGSVTLCGWGRDGHHRSYQQDSDSRTFFCLMLSPLALLRNPRIVSLCSCVFGLTWIRNNESLCLPCLEKGNFACKGLTVS